MMRRYKIIFRKKKYFRSTFLNQILYKGFSFAHCLNFINSSFRICSLRSYIGKSHLDWKAY
jgi:hypothetical protein